ncbi:hypothetical protein DEJ27_12110 [Curtobacterium sp. MCPF17_018]|uniref:AAA family ATPase n=1 Tax=Curtobacterium sp. MCPF17_018 TaxID=2175638 RepID=UPI000DB86710|nr:AAA family ATPase [Curtobacterium sp. MCPF17_018]PZE67361.1 hypothetical protein DEJ27_12110 [Curtobacterium sp. MCPF17_018]
MSDSLTSEPPVNVAPSVQRISSAGVLGEFAYDVDFEHSTGLSTRVKVIYAENGMGKTNFLKAVHHLLNPRLESLQALAELFVEDLSVKLTSGVAVSLERSLDPDILFVCAIHYPGDESSPTRVQVRQEDVDARVGRTAITSPRLSAYFNELRSLVSPTILIGDDRVVHASVRGPQVRPRRVIESEREAARARGRTSQNVRDALDMVERFFSRTAFAAISRDQSLSGDGIYVEIARRVLAGNHKDLLASEARASLVALSNSLLVNAPDYEKYGLMSFQQVRRINDQFASVRANNRNFGALQTILEPYLTSISDNVTALAPAHKLIDTFVTSVNSFLERKHLTFSTAEGIRLVGKSGEELEPDNLSSGEKHLLLLLSNAVLARTSNALLIIDEPELSLGLRWQRQLLTELLRCTDGSGVQFLVASHSVQVMGDIDDVVRPTEVN